MSTTNRASGQTSQGSPDADRPIIDPAADALNRSGFVSRVSSTLTREGTDEPLVVALEGAWGSGKTSILNLVAHELRNRTDVAVVRFNPWFFTGERELLLGLFAALSASIGASPTPARLAAVAALKRYAGVLAVAAALAPVAAAAPPEPHALWMAAISATATSFFNLFKSAKPAVEGLRHEATVEEMRRHVGEKLRKSEIRVVVLVDDIDRLYPDDVRAVFKLVRLVADLPRVSYLLAFDRSEVVACLNALGGGAREREHGDAYLEKIVQVAVPLPKLRSGDLRRIAYTGFEGIIERYALSVSEKEARRLATAWPLCFEQRPRTIRQVKRVVNAADFAVGVLSQEVNAVDLLLFESLRVCYPSVVDAIRASPACVLSDKRDRTRRTGEDESTDLDQELGRVEPGERAALVRFLGELFPRYAQPHSEGFDVQWRRELRICSEEHLSKLMDYGIPAGVISEADYAKLFGAAAQASSDDDPRLALALDAVVHRAGWTDLIWRLRQDQERLDDAAALRLILVVAQRSGALGRRDGIMGLLPSNDNGALLAMQVLRRLPQERRAAAARTIVASAGDLAFAARFVGWVVGVSEKDEDYVDGWEEAVESARAAFGVRADAELVGPQVLHDGDDQLLRVLFRWRDSVGIERFTATMQAWFAEDGSAAAALCALAIPLVDPEDWDSPMRGIPASSGYQNLSALLDPSLLAAALGQDSERPVTAADEESGSRLPHKQQARVLFLLAHQHRARRSGEPDELMLAVINVVSEEFLRTYGITTGFTLRRSLRSRGRDAVQVALDRCVPKWLGRGNAAPHDDYRPTLAGLLVSSRSTDVTRCVDLILKEMRDGVDREGASFKLRSESLVATTGFDVPFLAGVLLAGRLHGGGGSSGTPPTAFEYGPPVDVEEVIECENAAALARLRESRL